MSARTAAVILLTCGLVGLRTAEANPDAKRLYDDLLSNYNRYNDNKEDVKRVFLIFFLVPRIG